MICIYYVCIDNFWWQTKEVHRNAPGETDVTQQCVHLVSREIHIMIPSLSSLQHELSLWVTFTCLSDLSLELLFTILLQFPLSPRRSGLTRSIAASPRRNRSLTRSLLRPARRQSRSLPTCGSIVDTQSAAPPAALVRKKTFTKLPMQILNKWVTDIWQMFVSMLWNVTQKLLVARQTQRPLGVCWETFPGYCHLWPLRPWTPTTTTGRGLQRPALSPIVSKVHARPCSCFLFMDQHSHAF